jgi:hypothetical protein
LRRFLPPVRSRKKIQKKFDDAPDGSLAHLLARTQRQYQRVLPVELDLQARQFRILPVSGALRRFEAHRLHIEFEATHRDGELRPQLILFGLNFFGGQRRRIDQIATGQPLC